MYAEVEEGKLRGIQRKSRLNGKPFFAFLGIPYAKPPIGDLRFRAPVPHEKWAGVLHAVEDTDRCMQTGVSPGGNLASVGSEDCLYLNVYAPKVSPKSEKKLAVILCIHGGGFVQGSSGDYSPNFLIDYDVILVTLNYRLRVFGFLNAGTPNCPGNAGLKDQLFAIKWVKRNIASFGGDPENITLMGQCAGGSSVHLHMLSPLSKGLFKRAIIQSGNTLSPWAFGEDPESVAYEVGRKAGYTGHHLADVIDHLKNISADTLCKITFECTMNDEQIGAFLPDTPQNLMTVATAVPAAIGLTDQEGLITLNDLSAQLSESTYLLRDVVSLAIEDSCSLDEYERAKLIAEIDHSSFENVDPAPENVDVVVEVCTDLCHMKFFDAFDHYLEHLKKGATHGDDLAYLFEVVNNFQPMDEVDKTVLDQFCTLWINFAKTGDPISSFPSLDWLPHTERFPCYLEMGEELGVYDEKVWEARFDFWRRWSAKFF